MNALPKTIEDYLSRPQMNLVDALLYRHLANPQTRNATSLLYHNTKITYCELADKTSKIHELLVSKGVAPSQRVALLMDDSPSYTACLLATIACGAIVSPINPSLPPDDAEYMLGIIKPTLLFIGEQYAERFANLTLAPYLEHVVLCGDLVDKKSELEAALSTFKGKARPRKMNSDDIAYCLFSSGTTGRPKAIAHRHTDILHCAQAYAIPVLDLVPGDTTIAVSKLTFGYALVGNLLFSLLAGSTAVLIPEKSSCTLLIELIEKYKPTVLLAQPRMLSELLAANPKPELFYTLKVLSSAGEVLSSSLLTRWMDRYEIPILDGFGSTEVGHIFISNQHDDITPGCTGRILPGYECVIVDDQSRPVGDNTLGRLAIKGSSLFPYYWENPEETESAYQNGWLITKDLFYSKDGRYYASGRFDDMIKTGCGEWICPQEIEDVLLQHENVLECAVVGHSDTDGVIRLKGLVVTQEQAPDRDGLAETLIDMTKQRWDQLLHKQLHHIEFLPALPRSSTGKLQRFKLKSTTLNSFSYDC
jgi:acyl-coenzyme A synthetase/AMP-(fatty) acid ligase